MVIRSRWLVKNQNYVPSLPARTEVLLSCLCGVPLVHKILNLSTSANYTPRLFVWSDLEIAAKEACTTESDTEISIPKKDG
jgi:hypothetical protein